MKAVELLLRQTTQPPATTEPASFEGGNRGLAAGHVTDGAVDSLSDTLAYNPMWYAAEEMAAPTSVSPFE